MRSIVVPAVPRQRFLHLAGSAALAGLTGCGGGGSSAPTGPATTPPSATPMPTPTATPSPTPTPAGPSAAATVTITRTSYAGAVPKALVGLSYEKDKISDSFFTPSNVTLIGCFERLGTSILRLGGNSVDKTTWTPGGAGATTGQVAPADIIALAGFLQSTGWQIIYGINLASNTPASAAAEAAYAANAFGNLLYGFEIGNECDVYKDNGLRPTTYTLAEFIAEWSTYAAAIRASVPDAPLTGPASAAHVATWTVPFASSEASQIRLLTQHYYRANGQLATSTIELLLAGDPTLPASLQQLKSAAVANAIPNGYRLSECNSFYNGGAPNISDAYGTALWAIDFILVNAQNGSSGLNFHGGGDGPGYTPIADGSGAVVEVRPEYYGMLLVDQIAPGPMYPVTVASSLLLSAYAVAGSDGETYVVVVNKDPVNTAVTAVELGAGAVRATPLVLAGTGLNATTGTTLGGSAISNNGAWTPAAAQPIAVTGDSVTVNVAPASALLLAVH
jgi:hypothetical protein